MARILVVDDEEAIRDLLASLLQADGHKVTVAEDGEAGITAARRDTPDVIVTDLIMPRLCGLEAIPIWRALTPAPRVLAISGGARHGEHDALGEAQRLGADAVLEKPLDLAELRRTIATLLVE
ncbi:MAG: response regulator [Alphaproteobacteria bacterium]|nr:response regulator [Alphaproteobacteria bacterium]TAD91635.1 MAG: response regulator [Alphaproteobacteria bacterium]